MVVNLVVIPAALMLSVNILSYIAVTRATFKGRIKSESMQVRDRPIQRVL